MKAKNMRSTKLTKGQPGGFSLLEVLIALAVLSFGVLGMAQLFMLAISNNRRAAMNMESADLLSHRMEQYREVDFCILKLQANADAGAWKPDSTQFIKENTGQNAGVDGRVMQGRGDARIGGAGKDWIIERRLLGKNQGLTSIKDETGNNQAIPSSEDVLLIELRGYRGTGLGVPTVRKWVTMSTYRTKRNIQVIC